MSNMTGHKLMQKLNILAFVTFRYDPMTEFETNTSCYSRDNLAVHLSGMKSVPVVVSREFVSYKQRPFSVACTLTWSCWSLGSTGFSCLTCAVAACRLDSQVSVGTVGSKSLETGGGGDRRGDKH